MFEVTRPTHSSLREVRRTCLANFQNVRRRAAVKFNQMSGEKLQMSGEAKKDFAYTAIVKNPDSLMLLHDARYIL